MKRTLFFHYDFPPADGANVGHMLGIVNHLPEYGWYCHVVCGGEDFPVTSKNQNHKGSTTNDSFGMTRISETSGAPTNSKYFKKLSIVCPSLRQDFPDMRSLWIPMAVEKALELQRQQPFDAVISSCPSESNHVAASLFSRKTGIPWLPVFGDLFGWYFPKSTGWRQKVAAFASNYYFRNWIRPAKMAICVSPAMSRYLKQTYQIESKVAVVGVDKSLSCPSPSLSPNPKFTMTHTGSVYPGDQRPDLFLDAIKHCAETSSDFARLAKVLWVGSRCEDYLQALISERRLEPICEVRRWVDKNEASKLQGESDLLFALNTTAKRVPHGTYSYPSKLFEYLSKNRPIVVFPSDKEFVSHLMNLSQGTFDCGNIPSLIMTLLNLFQEWKKGTLDTFIDRSPVVSRLSQSCQTATIARELDLLKEYR